MKRRNFLYAGGVVGAVAVAGCLGSDPETDGDDANPIESDSEELLPSAELLGEGWEEDRTEDVDGRTSLTNEENEEMVNFSVDIYNSVDEAQSSYQSQREQDLAAGEEPGWSAEELQIASESHIGEFDIPIVRFRDANVVGEVDHARFGGGGSASTAKNTAAEWHETWRDN